MIALESLVSDPDKGLYNSSIYDSEYETSSIEQKMDQLKQEYLDDIEISGWEERVKNTQKRIVYIIKYTANDGM